MLVCAVEVPCRCVQAPIGGEEVAALVTYGFEDSDTTYEFGECDICETKGVLVFKHPAIWMCAKHWVVEFGSKPGKEA